MSFVVVAARVLLGVVFAVSAVQKCRDGRDFRRFVTAVAGRDLPVRAALAGTVAAEFATAALLLAPAGPGWRVPAGFVLSLGLLIVLTGVLLVAMRQAVQEPCGCFGTGSGPAGPAHVARNAVLAAAAVAGLAGAHAAPTGDLLVAATLGAAAAVVVIRLDDLKSLFFTHLRGYG
ncbi:MauE/DoxX family redox-associated membrane protein [Catenuloplanes japonicus]|uniref:MauE/DoxX family redox-associated membrane protein n=1 Tax=Catenuloplanes japonicus TaxID=33876 RepID=UPI00068ECDAE|nr:MauE/DoxX family redox-associated membrane protein [Catenuloplanes japonicus]